MRSWVGQHRPVAFVSFVAFLVWLLVFELATRLIYGFLINNGARLASPRGSFVFESYSVISQVGFLYILWLGVYRPIKQLVRIAVIKHLRQNNGNMFPWWQRLK